MPSPKVQVRCVSINRTADEGYVNPSHFKPRDSIIDETATEASTMSENTLKTRYEAESPDELALVKAACTYGCRLLRRTPDHVTVWLPSEYSENNFSFSFFCQTSRDSIGHSRLTIVDVLSVNVTGMNCQYIGIGIQHTPFINTHIPQCSIISMQDW